MRQRLKTESLIKTQAGLIGSSTQSTSASNRYTLGSGEQGRVNPGHWQNKSLCLPIIKNTFDQLNLTKYYVLDLGNPSNATMQFFQQWTCNYRLFDLYSEVCELYRDQYLDLQSYQELFEFPHPYDYQIDLILLWDQLSYFSRDNIVYLMDFLSNYSHEGTLLYFINSSNQYISKTPTQYSFADESTVSCSNFSNDRSHPSPRYTTRALSNLMPCFDTYKLSMLQKDVTEHLCVFTEYKEPPKLGVLS